GRGGERGHSAREELAAIAVIGRRSVEKLHRDTLRLAQVATESADHHERGADGVGERVVPDLFAQAHDLAEVLAELGDPPLGSWVLAITPAEQSKGAEIVPSCCERRAPLEEHPRLLVRHAHDPGVSEEVPTDGEAEPLRVL